MRLIGNSECADHGEVRIFCKIGVFYKWQEEKAEKESQAQKQVQMAAAETEPAGQTAKKQVPPSAPASVPDSEG